MSCCASAKWPPPWDGSGWPGSHPSLAPSATSCSASTVCNAAPDAFARRTAGRADAAPGPPPARTTTWTRSSAASGVSPAAQPCPATPSQLFHDGDQAYPSMLGAIASARTSIGLSSYIFRDDEWGGRFIDALAAAHERGITVRVLIDGVGGGWIKSGAYHHLRRRGVPDRPVPPLAPALAHALPEPALPQEDTGGGRKRRLHRRPQHRRRERHGHPARRPGAGHPFPHGRPSRLPVGGGVRAGLVVRHRRGARRPRLVPDTRHSRPGTGPGDRFRPGRGPREDRVRHPAVHRLRPRDASP